MTHYDIIIIGGGASGLCTAIMAKADNNRILIIEHNDRVGKKILSTGNGKCNLTNLYCKVEGSRPAFVPNPEGIAPYVSSSDNGFAEEVIARFDADDTVAFFENLGMLPLNKNGYIYPRSEQASSVLDLLRFSCERSGIEFLCGYQPISIRKRAEVFQIDDLYTCDKLVIATGGQNAAKTGSDGSGYEIARAFGHTVIKPVPGLCALKCSDPFFKELAGVRTDAKLTLYEKAEKERRHLMTVSGNLQLNSYGISGIPVFQLSLLASRLLAGGREVLVNIDFLPEIEEDKLKEFFSGKIRKAGDFTEVFLGVMNKKLAHVAEKESFQAHPNEKTDDYAEVFTHMIKRFKVHPTETVSFEEAQTTLGGVSTEEIAPGTMESKLVKGLYFTGEIVDVSGICGGYNLQWAWATAHVAAEAISL